HGARAGSRTRARQAGRRDQQGVLLDAHRLGSAIQLPVRSPADHRRADRHPVPLAPRPNGGDRQPRCRADGRCTFRPRENGVTTKTKRTRSKPDEKKSEATRRHLLERALVLFKERGVEATTMRDIAKAAGLSLGAAYYYFPSKEALVFAYYEANQ